MSGCRGSVQTLGPGRVKACWPAGARAPSGARERPPPPRRPWGGDRARGESLAGRGLERGRGRPRAQTWRSGRAVHLQLVDRLRSATDARPAASAGAAAPTCGVRVRRHHLPARLEPSAWPGPSPGGDLRGMTAESPEGGEGLRHPGHPILSQPGNETPSGSRPRARAAGPPLRGTGANPTQRDDP